MVRHNLYMFRCDKRLTQAQIAAEIGVSRQVYAYVEKGKRSGNQAFWDNLQKAFNVPDTEMYALQKLEREREETACEETNGQLQ